MKAHNKANSADAKIRAADQRPLYGIMSFQSTLGRMQLWIKH